MPISVASVARERGPLVPQPPEDQAQVGPAQVVLVDPRVRGDDSGGRCQRVSFSVFSAEPVASV
ncbi:hypothetical protein [Nocardioides sp. TF02-7]|uniref:hypothetical protein n=1 Tax=Nocardioides sp. TF02-7 TaxID=2917724 RepID=UPI001F062601|nr:hypothetical protein [Nocardioides sp. TF02-7]UMG93973.1 hypothetical protein MF408_07780 [Nocardioides sp. TF02-7]